MAEAIARFKPGENVPVYASASAITGGRFVKISAAKSSFGDYVATHCGAGELAFGVAEKDSAPTTFPTHSHDRRVNVVRAGAIAWVEAGAAVTALDEVQSNAAGKAITRTTGLALGRALTAAADDGDMIEVELYGAPTNGMPGSGDAYVEGTQQAFIADPADPAALTSAATFTKTAVNPDALTATNPDAIDAAAGEATAAALDDTQALEAVVSAIVVDITSIRTQLVAAVADLATLDTQYDALRADVAEVRTALIASNNKIDAILDVLIEYGQIAAS